MADLSPLGRLVCDPDRFLQAWQRGPRPHAPTGRSPLEQRLFHKSDVLTVHSWTWRERVSHTRWRILRRPEESLTSWMSQAGSPSLFTM